MLKIDNLDNKKAKVESDAAKLISDDSSSEVEDTEQLKSPEFV